MKILSRFAGLLTLMLLAFSVGVSAQNVTYYILQSPNLADAQAACQSYGLTMVSTIHGQSTLLVAASSAYTLQELQAWSQGDTNVKHIDVNHTFTVPEATQLATVSSPTVPLTTYVTNPNLVKLYGPNVWLAYVQQPAYYTTNAYEVAGQLTPFSQLIPATQPNPGSQHGHGNQHESESQPWSPSSGPVVIAVIDTGIDQLNPVPSYQAMTSPEILPGLRRMSLISTNRLRQFWNNIRSLF